MPRGTVDAARALLETFQNLASPEETGAKQVEIREFLHGNNKIRGLGTVAKIPKGAAVVKIPSEYSIAAKDVTGDRFDGGQDNPGKSFMDEKTKLGLWLAEKKNEWLDHPAHKLTPTERYWRDAINSYPTLDDYESRGVPLAASEQDLTQIASLPAIGNAAHWASGARGRLAMAQVTYNTAVHRAPTEGHAALNWEDTLWGRILASTGSFGVPGICGGGKIAPVADLVNHSDDFNATFECNDTTGELKIISVRDIQPGEEVTIAYKNQAPALFQFYGIVEHVGAPQYLPDDACYALRDAHLEEGTSPLLKTAEKFAEMVCAATPPKVEMQPAADQQPLGDMLTAPAAEPVLAKGAPEAPLAIAMPNIAVAALNPLFALLQPLMRSVQQESASSRATKERLWRSSRAALATCPVSKTDFI